VDRDGRRHWSIGRDFRPEPDHIRQLGEERVRQPIHAADDLLHVDVGLADVLAQLLRRPPS
jgi:hypothetical protein